MDVSISTFIDNILHVAESASHDLGNVHPLIVHFPIALLCVVPLFIVLGLIFIRHARMWNLVSLVLLILGTASIYVAIHTGELATEPLGAEIGREAIETLDRHDRLAHKSRDIFLGLSILMLVYVIAQYKWDHLLNRNLQVLIAVTFLLLYLAGLLFLINTSHYGGKLVHQHGVHTQLYKDHSNQER